MRQENCELEVSLGNTLRPAKKAGEKELKTLRTGARSGRLEEVR